MEKYFYCCLEIVSFCILLFDFRFQQSIPKVFADFQFCWKNIGNPFSPKNFVFFFCPIFFYFENCQQKWPQKFVGQFLIKCCWDKKYLQKKSFSLSQAQSCFKERKKCFWLSKPTVVLIKFFTLLHFNENSLFKNDRKVFHKNTQIKNITLL
jgi:hypothetical protein